MRHILGFLVLDLILFQGVSTRKYFWEEDSIWNDAISTSPITWVLQAETLVTCALHCTQDLSCETFFYQPNLRQCQGHSTTLPDKSGGFTSAPGAKYYRVGCVGGKDYRYVREHDFCFKAYEIDSISWMDANNDCISRGGHLLEFDSIQVALWWQAYLSSMPGQYGYWLGLTDTASEGTFRWTTTGQVHVYSTEPWKSLWKSGQPDNSNNQQHCGMIFYAVIESRYAMDDFNCVGLGKRHICQTDVI